MDADKSIVNGQTQSSGTQLSAEQEENVGITGMVIVVITLTVLTLFLGGVFALAT